MKIETLKHHVGLLMAVLVIFLILAVGYFNFIDGTFVRKPITFTGDPMTIVTDKTVYKRGETVKGHLSFCKHRNIKATIQWTLVDHILIFFPANVSALKAGCDDKDFVIQTIPKNVTPEEAMYFEGLIQYQVNPFSVITVPLKTQTFQVI